MAHHIVLGEIGETAAVKYLTDAGFAVIDRNWRCAHGEVDIVATEHDALVFIEVKTRSSIRYGHPLEAITRRKYGTMLRVAQAWRNEHPELARYTTRFDAIGVILPPGGNPAIMHIDSVAL